MVSTNEVSVNDRVSPSNHRNAEPIQDQPARQRYLGGDNATVAEDWNYYLALADRRATSGQSCLGFATGLPGLDTALGGLNGLTFIGGETGVGKTSLVLSMAIAALRSDPDLALLIYSLDLDRTKCNDRLLCAESGVEYRTLCRGPWSHEDLGQLRAANERLIAEILPRMRIICRQFPPPRGGFWESELR